MVYAPDLDLLVWKEITSLLSSPQTMLEAYKQQWGKNGLRGPDVVEAEPERLDERIGDVERQIQRLLDGYQSGFIYPRSWLGAERRLRENRPDGGSSGRNSKPSDRSGGRLKSFRKSLVILSTCSFGTRPF